ncbi:TAXI family TRAP transporter solute-binding subunit [Halomonas organivorans]|uniref:ABC transporter substrate-binding protein n=1 Tax=Halomonas organivorans TaxID=257772 RepID=A0A7W5BZS6_9GAMM|nr:TAXI family TRAP transporter solute-binding subunit [Halomonas organivorans]MBB3142152.1 hypothetical protein [Halomonas organivorans]
MTMSIKKTLMAAALVVPAMAANVASAQSYNMTVAGASPGGLWSLLGAGLDSAMKAEFPGSTVTYQTSGGGLANVAVLQRDDASLAIIEDAVLQRARDGEPPFREPSDDLRVIANLYTWAPMQPVIREAFAEEYDIDSFADIGEVKPPITIAINKRGNIASSVAETMLETIGASPEELKSWGGDLIYAASSEQSGLIQDRRADMILNSLFVGHSSLMQAGTSVDLTLLPLSDDIVQEITQKTGTTPFVIPGGSYDWAPNDIPTVSISATLAVRSDMDEQQAYDLTKAVYENYEKIANVHPAMRSLTPEIMASVDVIPYHDGAMRYLKEAGLR